MSIRFVSGGRDPSAATALNPFGWVYIAAPGFVKVNPYGDDSAFFVNAENAPAIQAEIDRQNSLPTSLRNYTRLWALLDADALQNPDTVATLKVGVDPRLARALALGYGSEPTEEMLIAADQGIAYEDWRAMKMRQQNQGSTPGGNATIQHGPTGPQTEPTIPAPIPSVPRPDIHLIAAPVNGQTGTTNTLQQTPTGGVELPANLVDTIKKVPLWAWIALGVLAGWLIIRK